MTTLSLGAESLTLPDDLLWVDEFDWETVRSVSTYGVDGALFTDSAARLAGRPITLRGARNHGWVLRSTVVSLEAWRALPGQLFTLTLRGVARQVRFDHERGAMEAAPLLERREYIASDPYIVTLRFLQQA